MPSIWLWSALIGNSNSVPDVSGSYKILGQARAFCPLRGNLFALLSARCFLHHLDLARGFQLLSLFGKPWHRSARWQSPFVSCRAHWRWHQDIVETWSWLTWVVSSLLLILITQDRDQFHVDIQFLYSLISASVIVVSFKVLTFRNKSWYKYLAKTRQSF